MTEFQQYELKTDDGADLLVAVQEDRVVVRQQSQGTGGRGAALLTAHEGHELARQLENASQVAMSFKPPEAPAGGQLNSTPDVQQALNVLGEAGIAAIVTAAVRSMTPEQLAAARGEAQPQA